MQKIYRSDIDGLRAIAVISVILFHLGYLPNGYLGVDVFFVISGYLISGIVYNEIENNNFSITKFYERRIRRIIPLVLFTTLFTFILGLVFMLPDDLENLCQSIFATNFSANNILMKITSSDYWSVKNDYKPLMHTWSLGVEEQFYLLYPLIFLVFRRNKKYIISLIIFLTLISISFFIFSTNNSSKFYLLQFRFYELSIGGICSIYFFRNEILFKQTIASFLLVIFLLFMLFLLCSDILLGNDLKILLITLITTFILVIGKSHYKTSKLYSVLLSNKIASGVGKISFSLYMWHQIVFAFSRYFLVEKITVAYSIILSFFVIILSIITYFFIETPFRNKNFIKTKMLFLLIVPVYILIIVSSLYVYMIGGIIKDIPELGIIKSKYNTNLNFFNSQDNIHIKYNEDIRRFDKPFTNSNTNKLMIKKIKILVIGNSFGRDASNILLESSFKDSIELRYSDKIYNYDVDLINRISDADYIFYASDYPNDDLINKLKIDKNKLWIFGTKDFGNSIGIHFNRKITDYKSYRASMKIGVYDLNTKEKNYWKDKYIDLISYISDSNQNILVFTPEGKFISQDTIHLTKSGAIYFANLLNSKFKTIFKFT